MKPQRAKTVAAIGLLFLAVAPLITGAIYRDDVTRGMTLSGTRPVAQPPLWVYVLAKPYSAATTSLTHTIVAPSATAAVTSASNHTVSTSSPLSATPAQQSAATTTTVSAKTSVQMPSSRSADLTLIGGAAIAAIMVIIIVTTLVFSRSRSSIDGTA